jgi:hypothetical protein
MNENKIEQQVFNYPFLFRIIFRYGNIIVTFLLVVYSIPLAFYVDERKILLIPLIVTIFIIYFLNKHYLNLYKILPYKIIADEEKLVCTDFFLSKKKFIIYYEDIASLTGGIFENKISGVMKVCDGKNGICIGFYHRLNNAGKLTTIILSKVKRELYDEVLEKLTREKKI